MALPVVRESWFTPVLRRLGLLEERPEEFIAGADYVPYPVPDDYSPLDSLSAFAALPWVRAAVDAIAIDLAGLPIVVERIGGDPAPDHPIVDILERPSVGVSLEMLRQQIVVDLVLTGNAYLLVLYAGAKPVSVRRLHPQRVEVIPGPPGVPAGFRYNGSGRIEDYAPDAVVHVRGPSWEDGPGGLLGTGAVQALHNDLTAEIAATKRDAESAQQGRPDAIVSPADGQERWAPNTVEEMKRRVREAFAAAHGGVVIFGGQAKVTPLSWSPAELATGEASVRRREAVLAVLGVPPTRLQLPTANYAQSTDAMRQYWSTLQGRARVLDAAWTAVAAAFGDRRIRVRHDFSAVPYLQEDRSLRLQRVSAHILHGMSPRDAYAYEGFRDAPLIEEEVLTAGAPVSDTALNGAQIESLLSILNQLSAGLLTVDGAVALMLVAFPSIDEAEARQIAEGALRGAEPNQIEDAEDAEEVEEVERHVVRRMPRPVEEADRAAVWRGWASNQVAVEARMRMATARYLRGAQQRIPARAARLLGEQRDASGLAVVRSTEPDLEALIGREEADALARELGPEITRALQLAFRLTARQMGASIEWSADRSAGLATIAESVQQITDATRDRVRELVAQGLRDGLSSTDIATRIQSSESLFGPARAMNIARTESTNALNLGAVDAMSEAAATGVRVRKEWLSSRDGAVRPAHRALDGQVVGVGESFVVPLGTEYAGAEAKHPGGFSEPALTCNCRCTVLPVVED